MEGADVLDDGDGYTMSLWRCLRCEGLYFYKKHRVCESDSMDFLCII